jgi:uncharacterized protein YggE
MFARILVAGMAILALVTLTGCSGGGRVTSAQAGAAALAPDGPVPAEGITVTGLGEVTGTPDVLRATVGVNVLRPDVQSALDAANTAAAAVLAALADNGVAEDDIQTREFSVHPEQRYREDSGPETVGYRVTNLVEAKIRELDRVGQVLAAVVETAGDDAQVQGVAFALEDNAELLDAARAAAFADARAKAEDYADLAGRGLGQLVSVSEVTADRPPPIPFGAGGGEEAAMDSSVPIAPGQQDVAVTVTTVWRME